MTSQEEYDAYAAYLIPSSEAGSDYEQLPSQAQEIARTEDRRQHRMEEE
jgi:hypothetical protein